MTIIIALCIAAALSAAVVLFASSGPHITVVSPQKAYKNTKVILDAEFEDAVPQTTALVRTTNTGIQCRHIRTTRVVNYYA